MVVYVLGERGFHPIESPDIPALLASNTVFWIDMVGPTHDHVGLMRDVLGFHPLAVEDTINQRQRPKVEEYGDHIFTILNTISVTDGEVEFAEVDLFVNQRFLVTVHEKPDPLIDHVIRQCNTSGHSLPISVGYAVYALMNKMIDDYFPILDDIGDEIEAISESILEKPQQQDLSRLFKMKRMLTEIWRVSGQQRDMFSYLTRDDSKIVNDQVLRYYLRDVYDHLLRVSDTVNTFRDTLSNVVDLYLSSFSNHLNVTVRRLTVLTIGIGIMTVISGFYGMNFERTFPPFDAPWGVPFVLVLMLAGIAVLWLYVRRMES